MNSLYNELEDDIIDMGLKLQFEFTVNSGNLDKVIELCKATGIRGDNSIFRLAIKQVNIEIVKYLSEGRKTNYIAYYSDAIVSDRLQAVEHFMSLSWPYTRHNIFLAISYHRYDILIRFIDHDKTLDTGLLITVFWKGFYNEYYFTDEVTIEFIKKVILYIINRNIEVEWYTKLIYYSISYGLLDLAKFMYEHNIPYDNEIYTACGNSLEKVKFVHDTLGIKIDNANPISRAVSVGSIECFEYMVANNFLITKEAISSSLCYGNVTIIKYLHDHGYEWDPNFNKKSIERSARKYCHDNNIPKKWKCRYECSYCRENRKMELDSLWILDKEEYDSMIQWPPREILEELIELVNT